jgi:hypothetical protein
MKDSFIHYGTVFISGASILALEILGTRMIGPYFGINLFLWTALLTVTLIALALGYFLGGRLADKKPSYRALSTLILLTAMWLFMLPYIAEPLAIVARDFGYRFGVVFVSLCLFTLPLSCLGCVTPYVLKLRVQSLANVATEAGNLYAFSTVASVLAALASGYYFIPFVGVKEFTHLIAVVLIFLSLTLFFYPDRK